MTDSRYQADIAILGAGFGGSLTALLIKQRGLKPLLIERGAHPRFALGESATPLADLVLADLARRYDLPRIAPLSEYGSWRRTYPQLVCGLKRGFSYYHHQAGLPWRPRPKHGNELLVAASLTADDADTHWLRSHFDHFLLGEAQAAGIPYLERTQINELAGGPPWVLSGSCNGRSCSIAARFLIDASGEGRALARLLKITDHPDRMRTNSRAVYGHFADVRPWRELLLEYGCRVDDHPFDCDDAALHHVFDGGWMWVLRFGNGVTSAGWLLDQARWPLDPSRTATDEWAGWLARFPSIERQFSEARWVDPPDGLRRTGRLQHRLERAAGAGWAMLPATVYTLDALHSTGNAHTLSGIERLIDIIERSWDRPEFSAALADYDLALQAEVSHLDTLVHGCYRAMGQFELFAAFAMFYFAAAHTCEMRRRGGASGPAGFLLADDAHFGAALDEAYRRLNDITQQGRASDAEIGMFAKHVAAAIRPFNTAGLCDPTRDNLYPYVVSAV